MNTKITFHSGVQTIGGVVMELEYGNDRIIMEIGTAYNPETDVYDGIVEPRQKSWLKDALRLKQAPAVAGIYAKSDLQDYPLLSAEESHRNTAIFITHLHLDHMSCMGMVSPLIPVYLTKPAQIIEYALEDIGEGVVGHRRNYLPLQHQEVIKIGEIEVLPFVLNNRSYQDLSFYIKTPDLKLHYTGDLFLHGDYVAEVVKEMNFLKEQNIDVLVCESTTFMDSTMKMIYESGDDEVVGSFDLPEGLLNKEMLDAELTKDLSSVKGLCVVNFYNREMSDVESFTEMAKTCNRELVLEPETAHIVHQFFGTTPAVYLADYAKYEANSAAWFQEVLANSKIVTKEDLFAHPEKYLLQNSYPNILELFDLPNKDAAYLHSGGMPLGDYDPAYHNLMRVLKLVDFTYLGNATKNYFSHAYPPQVKYYVDQVDATILVPTHGYRPDRLKASKNGIQFIPEVGKTYQLTADKKNLTEVK